MELHVDGSGVLGGSWAFMVLWKSADGICHFGGFRSGHVATRGDDCELIGACGGGSTLDASSAELSGMSWACSPILWPWQLLHLCRYLLRLDGGSSQCRRPVVLRWCSCRHCQGLAQSSVRFLVVDAGARVRALRQPFQRVCRRHMYCF